MSRLRSLARSYAAGEIDRRTYIHERRALIDTIVDGDLSIRFPEPPPELDDPDEADTTVKSSAEAFDRTTRVLEPGPFDEVEPGPTAADAAPAATGRPRGSAKPLRLAAIFGVLAVAVAAAGYWWTLTDRATPTTLPPASPLPARPPAAAAADPLERFLDEGDWSARRLEALLAELDGLDPAALDAAGAKPRFTLALKKKYVEEKALIDLGENDEGRTMQRLLLDVAARLALDPQYFDRLRQDWAESAERRTAGPEAPAAAVADATTEPATDDASPPPAVATETAASAADAAAPETTIESAEPAPAAVAPVDPPQADPVPAVGVAGRPTRPALTTTADATTDGPSARRRVCPARLARSRRRYCRDELPGQQLGPDLVVVPAGTFAMGGPEPAAQPRREITIPRALAFGVYEVSVAEFELFCRAAGRSCPEQPWSDDALPVVNLPWQLAVDYTTWLSEQTGAVYRLPSEAEWEYATRAGSDSRYPFGGEVLPTDAHFSFMRAETKPLAARDHQVNRNRFRLYHTVGNVREWVLDAWTGDLASVPPDGSPQMNGELRVARGGSYSDGGDGITSSVRVGLDPSNGDRYTGFRVVREAD